MRNFNISLFCFFIIFFSIVNSFSETNINSINIALQYYDLANKAFASGNHNSALSYYSAVENFLKTQPQYKKYFDHHYRNFSIIQMVKEHQKLGNFTPVITHKISVIYIEKTNTTFKNKALETSLTSKDISKSKIAQSITKKYFEVMTNGKASLEFKRIFIKSAVTSIDPLSKYDDRQAPEIIINSIQPYPSNIISELSSKSDTFLFYWKAKSDSVKYTGPYGWGGAYRLPIIPYSKETPLRGRIIISSQLMGNPGTLFHELFHTVEKIYSIYPIHGFRKTIRNNFPQWKGTGEFNYYQYHYNNILKSNTIKKISIHNFYTFNEDYSLNNQILDNYRNTKQDNIIKALQLYHLSKKSSDKTSISRLKSAVKYYPEFTPAIFKLGTIHYFSKNHKAAEKYIRKAYTLNPNNPEICYMYGVISNRNNNTNEAIKMMTHAVNLNPNFFKGYQYRGFLYFRKGLYSKAEQDFITASKLNKKTRQWVINYLKKQKNDKKKHADILLKKIEEKT